MNNDHDSLKLENQLCFPLYAAAREIIKLYHPYLSELSITYTQYVVLMVLWEHKKSSVKDLGEKLHLDSGTLTPLLKGLESKGYITRKRSDDDERCVTIELTADGELMKDKAADIPAKMAGCVKLDREEASVLYKLLYKILDSCQD